MINQQL